VTLGVPKRLGSFCDLVNLDYFGDRGPKGALGGPLVSEVTLSLGFGQARSLAGSTMIAVCGGRGPDSGPVVPQTAIMERCDLAIQRYLTTFADQGRRRRRRPRAMTRRWATPKTPLEIADGVNQHVAADKATYSDLVLAWVGIGLVVTHAPAADPDATIVLDEPGSAGAPPGTQACPSPARFSS